MKKTILMALTMLTLNSALAATGNTLALIQGETAIVTLQGKFAEVERSSKTQDDLDEIEKCGTGYSVLLLNEPVRVSLTSMESEKEYDQVVQYVRIWGSPEVKALDGEQVEVRGVLGEALMGTCSPGLAIQAASFYPNAK